eukprot:gene3521-3791_t
MRRKPSLLKAIIGAYGGSYCRLGVLKLLNDGLTFAGAMLLNLLVQHLEQATGSSKHGTGNQTGANGVSSIAALGSSGTSQGSMAAALSGNSSQHGMSFVSSDGGLGWLPSPGSPGWGFVLAAVLGLSALAKAVIGSHYNYGLSLVTIRLRSGVMGVLFRTALLTRAADAAGGDVNTLMAVDTSRLANLCVSFHELWSLPLQIAAAMYLLYVQVRVAFLAGVLLCVALIPINRMIAQRIQAASVDLMSSKDSRLGLMGEILHHMGVVKALGWERVLAAKASVDDSLVAEASVDDSLVAEASVDDSLVAEASVHDSLVAEASVHDSLVAEASVDDSLVAEASVDDSLVAEAVTEYRQSELKALALRKYLDALCVYFWAATQLLLSGTTFGLMVLLGQPLRPSVVFTSLALFNVLIAPLNAFPWVVNGVVEAWVSLKRLQSYLLLPQRSPGWAYADNVLPQVLAFQRQRQQQLASSPSDEHAAAGWRGATRFGGRDKRPKGRQRRQRFGHIVLQGLLAAEANKAPPPVLQRQRGVAAQFCNATFTWKKVFAFLSKWQPLATIFVGCHLTAVVGEVGSGKSSLLAALLGELELTQGSALLANQLQQCHQLQHSQQQVVDTMQATVQARVGFVSQTPWLMRGTVRDNVLLGQPYNAELMQEIFHAVGLDQDLAAMPAGDLTQVGEGGSGLSGGQRLRVALARALYQPGVSLYLFDDILASLDGHVAQWVIRHALFGGLLSGATVVIATKHPLVIQAAHLVLGLQHGRVEFCGSPSGFAHWKATQSHPHLTPPLLAQDSAAPRGGAGWSPLVAAISLRVHSTTQPATATATFSTDTCLSA